MAEILVDSYSESNYSRDQEMYLNYIIGEGQSFTAIKGNLSSCKFYLKKYGSPTGNAVAKLYAHTGTYGTSSKPTGSALATSDNFDVSTLTTSYQLITFNFTGINQYELVNGVYYCITIEYSGGSVNNWIIVGIDDSSPTHSGNESYYSSGAWNSESTDDLCFYVYALEPPLPPQPAFLLNFV